MSSVRVPNSRRGARPHLGRTSGDDLGQGEQLGHRPTLGDPLGAERHVDGDAVPGEEPFDVLGDPGVDRAAQHDQLAVPVVADHAFDRPRHLLGIGVEVLVHRSPDHHDDDLAARNGGRIGGGGEQLLLQSLVQQLLEAVLAELQHAAGDPGHRSVVDVVDADPAAARGQRHGQWEPDVAAATDDDDVEVGLALRGTHRRLIGPGRGAQGAAGDRGTLSCLARSAVTERPRLDSLTRRRVVCSIA